MSDDTRTIEEIEADLERDRAALNDNFSALQQRLSLKGVAQEALGLFGGAGPGKASAAALSGAPLAALAVGAGLGWLASGKGKGKGGAGSSTTAATLAAATAAQVVSAMEPEDIRAVAKEIDQIYRAGAARLKSLHAEMRDKAEGAAEALREGADQARGYAADKARILADVAAEAKARLESGLDGLSDEAAAAVIAAREQAYQARRAASRKAGEAYDEIAAMVDKAPIATGVAAFAAGALIAVALRAFGEGGRR